MADSFLHIDTEKELKPGFDFTELRKEGIKLIEQFCGSIWTDYNEHDPGITILEQLIFALTELSYRTDFEVKDILADFNSGVIQEHEQVLLSADEIMPCSSLTPKDYTQLLYDNIKGLANAWLDPIPIEKKGVNGLYEVSVFVYDIEKYHSEKERKRIKHEVIALLNDNRNLCEDFEEVQILGYVDFYINADIEISSASSPEEILAEIFFRVSNYVAPEVKLHTYLELREKDQSIDEIFTGPSMQHGLVDTNELRDRPTNIYDTQVINIINGIKGVKSIKNLKLSLNGNQFTTHLIINDSQILRYKLRSLENEKRFRFFKGKNTRRIHLNPRITIQELDNLKATHRRIYQLDEQHKKYLNLPMGSKVKFDSYYSIQNQFPHIYGINHFGVPSSESPLRKAQAKQLKAYLLIFEQIMVNYLSQLRGTKDLFSIRENSESTYFYNLLDKKKVPNVKGIYDSNSHKILENDLPDDFENRLSSLLNKFDNKLTRKNKFLDYLLSLYGERFYQYTLSRLNYYYTKYKNEKNVIKNKINFLKNIKTINRERGTGYNYRKLYAIDGNISGAEQKVKLLLDINDNADHNSFDSWSLLSVFDTHGLKLISEKNAIAHDCYEFDDDGLITSSPISDSAVNYFFEGFSYDENRKPNENEMFDLLPEITFIEHGVIDEGMLRAAIDPKNFKIGTISDNETFIVIINTEEDNTRIWKRLGIFDGYEKALNAIYTIIDLAKALNIASEGFHIIEHILLRPKGDRETALYQEEIYDLLSLEEALEEDEQDFYSFRVSIVLPNWTARFNDERFQELAKETFHLNIPAHVSVDYFWLDPEEMCDFETSYRDWLAFKANPETEEDELELLSYKLELFLRRQKIKKTRV